MRIPTSVIVMSLLTAAPFGLAIRDTLKKKQPVDELEEMGLDSYERRSARRDREALAEYEAEAAREAEAEGKKTAAKFAQLDTLFGSEKATLGTVFSGAQIGSALGDAAMAKLDEVAQEGFIQSSVDYSDITTHTLQTVSIRIDDDTWTACEKLRTKLVAAWGPSSSGTWIAPSTHTRASLDDSPCQLTFERYLDTTQWLAALPLDMIGQPGTKLVAKAGGDAAIDGSQLEWSIPGTGYGREDTDLFASIENGKVTGIHVSTDTDFDNLLAIRDALSAKLKAQPERDEDTGAWVWKKKPGFTLTQASDDNRFMLQIGKDPYQ